MIVKKLGVRLETGHLLDPSGNEYVGFKFSNGPSSDRDVKRTSWIEDLQKDRRFVCEGKFPNLRCRYIQ